MKTATVKITGISPYGQTRFHNTPKLEKEGTEDYRKRTWREHAHFDKNGNVFIPPMAFKNCLAEAAKYLSIQIPGKGKATYTKHIEAGVLVVDPPMLGITKDDMEELTLFLPSDGIRGSGKRVLKTYPIVREWKCVVTFMIYDETVTREVFDHIINEAGKFIGIGWFRPRNNGYFGRFMAEVLSWE